MHYKIEVLIKSTDSNGAIVESWQAMRPINCAPYRFDTEKQAESAFNLCYPKGSKARIENKARIVKYEN